jgi:hypothetical protein
VSFLSKLASGQTDLISYYTTRPSNKKGDTFKWMIEDIQMLVGIQEGLLLVFWWYLAMHISI